MKNFKYLILFLSLIIIFEMTTSKDANAAACATTTGNIIDASEVPSGSGCSAANATQAYEVTVYAMYMCNTKPTAPTSSAVADLSNCSEVFVRTSGSTVSFASGEDVVLEGSFTKPPLGTYTHAYVKLDNVFGITSAMQFDASTAGASGTGVHCFTPTAGAQDAHEHRGTHSISVCAGTATTPGKFIETINHWGNPNTASHQPCIVDSTPTSSCGTEGAYLVDTNQFVSTGDNDTDALHGILPFDKPIKVTPQTNTLITRFSVTLGTQIADTSPSSGLQLYIGTGPFEIQLEVQ